MGMIIIPCFIVIAIIAVVIFIMAIKACNMEKREDRQMTLAGIILMVLLPLFLDGFCTKYLATRRNI